MFRKFYTFSQKNKLQKLQQRKEETIPQLPNHKIRKFIFHLVDNQWFEIINYVIVLLNLIPIIMELLLTKDDENLDQKKKILQKINISFFALYLIEATVKVSFHIPQHGI